MTLYDRSGAVVQRLTEHPAAVRDVVLSPDGTRGATVGDGGAVVLWDVDPTTGRWSVFERLVGHSGNVVEAEMDPAGETLVTASPGELVIAWNIRDEAFGDDFPGPPGRRLTAPPVVIDPGRLVVAPTVARESAGEREPPGTWSGRAAATFIDPRDGAVVGQVDVGVPVDGAFPGAFATVSPDGRLIAVTAGLSTEVIDVRTRRLVERIELPADGDVSRDGRALAADLQCCAVWTPDGSRLLIGTRDNELVPSGFGEFVVIDTATWQEEVRYNPGLSPQVIRTSPDGRWIVVAGGGQWMTVLDAETIGMEAQLRLDEPEEITDVAFSRDGRFLAGVGSSGQLRLFDIGTWSARGAVPLPGGPGVQVEWLADDRTVVTAGADGTVSLFDIERPLVHPRALSSPERPGVAAHLMPEPSDEIVLLRADGTGHRYPLDPAMWLRNACTLTGRDLSRQEWERYLPDRAYQPTCSDLG